MKLCKRCMRVKRPSHFNRSPTDGRKALLRGVCKECTAVVKKAYRESPEGKVAKARENKTLRQYLRVRLNNAMKSRTKSGSAVRDLGCSIDFLRGWLEGQFRPGMNWSNHGRFGWHIDHIKPLASFDLTRREELLIACNYKNLQPLWAEENLRKSDKT